MAVEARRMVAVQLPMAAVQLLTAVALLPIVVVVAAEASRIVDPETFPKGPPISSRRAFGFLGSISPVEEPPTTLQWFACSIGSLNPGVSKFDKVSRPSPGCSSESVIV